MRSARLGTELEARLARAAAMEGISVSELIRQCVAQRCDAILGNRLDLRLADVVGTFRCGGGWADVSAERMAEMVNEDAGRKRRHRDGDAG